MIVTVPIKLINELNARGPWQARARRAKAQRQATALALAAEHARLIKCGDAILFGGSGACLNPCTVVITRIAPGTCDDDGLAASAKHVRDEIAKWLGRDDKPDSGLSWVYRQSKGGRGVYAVEIWISETR